MKEIWILSLCITLGVAYRHRVSIERSPHPTVNTNVGVIKGLQADDWNYSMYLGIPYARVNEDNPFGAALPYPRFDTPYEAYNDSKICPQSSMFHQEITGTLDCLRLNVYVPNTIDTNKKPVIIWIHGGGFSVGSSSKAMAGPKYIIRHNVIMVSINYRLGVYGFMCLDTAEVPGNQGLKDQYIAIKWVKDNIEAFGGDASKITVMGESAGAMSIDYHLLTKRDKHFTKAIMESGSALCPKEIVKSDTTAPFKIAKKLGHETNDLSEAVKFISKADPISVIAVTAELELYFRACVEKDFDNVEKFVFEHPQNCTPNIGNMPILAGFNSAEQLGLYINEPPIFFANLTNFLYDRGDEFHDVDNIVRHFYIGDHKVTDSLKWQLIKFASDYKFNYPIQKGLIRYLKNGGHNIYQYMFSYGGRKDYEQLIYVADGSTPHGAELEYLFDKAGREPTPEAMLMIDRMTAMWTNFAKFGNPTPRKTPLLPVTWPPITEDVVSYLNIDSQLTVGTRPYHQRMVFWELFNKLYPEEFQYQ